MISRLGAACILVCFAGACGRPSAGSPRPASAPSEPAAGVSSAAFLSLGRVTFFAGEDQPGPVLHGDGRVEMAGRLLGTLSSDGVFASAEGQPVATLHRDGRLVVVGNEGQEIRVSEEGTLSINDRTVVFDEGGRVSGAAIAGPSLRAEGLSEETRRAAMVVLVLTLLPRRAEPAAPPPTE